MENNRCRSMEKGCFRQINKWDIAAILLGLCLLVFFVITAGNGVGMPDEAFYYTVPQRILNGDRLFVDEWHLTQLASLFSVLPYWIFTKVTGGTEGLILYMRLFFTAVNMLFYAYLYCRLRRYGGWGLLSAFLFCAILPEVNYAVSYFTVSSMAMTVVCIIFFTGKAPGIARSLAAGVCFASGVVAELLLFLLYPVFRRGEPGLFCGRRCCFSGVRRARETARPRAVPYFWFDRGIVYRQFPDRADRRFRRKGRSQAAISPPGTRTRWNAAAITGSCLRRENPVISIFPIIRLCTGRFRGIITRISNSSSAGSGRAT